MSIDGLSVTLQSSASSVSSVVELSSHHYNARGPISLRAGARLGAYEIVAPLGAGGMGEVYRARDTKLNREAAITIVPEALASDPVALARFQNEAQAVAALSHPNILEILDFGIDGGIPYAVMKLLDGGTLRARLSEGALPPRKAVEYATL